jgi:plastocyanin
MEHLNRFSYLIMSFVLFVGLLLGGCSSTDSNSYSDPGEDSDPNPTVNFNSGDVNPDESYSYTFENEGTVDYYCQYHEPDMQGEITVSSSVEAAERDTVFMEGMQFNPAQLSVAPGTEVVWVNVSDLTHTVTSGNPDDNNDDGDY